LKKCIALLFLVVGSSAWAAPVYNMLLVGSQAGLGFFTFNVNGTTQQLLCDQFLPNVTTQPYQALGYSLGDLSGTVLGLAGDPQALQKYQQVAILDLQAYANPSLAADVVRANRLIVDGSGPLTGGAQALLNFVQTQNPANYPQLASFLIFTNPITQEMTGFIDTGSGGGVPEPGTWGVTAAAAVVLSCLRRRRARE
jgi:hypothetical protein